MNILLSKPAVFEYRNINKQVFLGPDMLQFYIAIQICISDCGSCQFALSCIPYTASVYVNMGLLT